MSVTIKDVAKMAGVSISTVSRVINNSKPVSEDIKERVLEVIKKTNYVPNPVARSLVLKKSNFIGVIMPNLSNNKVGEILSGIEEVGKLYDYDILLCNSYGELEEELRYIELLRNKQVAGIVFMSWNLQQEAIEKIEASGIPSIYIAKNAREFNVFSVGVDHRAAGKDVGEYLVKKRKNEVMFITQEGNENSFILEGIKIAYEKIGRNFDDKDILKTKDNSDSAYELMDKYIKSGKHIPEAIFATTDDMAAGTLNALMDNGINVPEKVSVIGYDNTKISRLTRPKLTTVDQPLYDIGAISIRTLIKMVEGSPILEKNISLPHKIIERESSN